MSDENPKRRPDREFTDMYQRPNDDWYLRYWSRSLGRVIEIPLDTKIRARAVRERKRRIENIRDEKSKEAAGYKRFKQVIEAFKHEIVWDAKATELSAMNQLNNHILPYFGGYRPDAINNNLWRRYAKERRENDPKCSMLNAGKYLGMVVNWAFDKKIIKKKFVPDNFDEGRESPGVELTDNQFEAIFRNLNDTWKDIASLAWYMAFRVGEAKGLLWKEVSFETDEISLDASRTKTRYGRKPVMPQVVRTILLRRLNERAQSSPYVFPGRDPGQPMSKSDSTWQRAKELAGVTCRFHDLRHTWLTRAFRNSNRYAQICEYAGLSLDEAMNTYVKITRADMAGIAEVINKTLGTTGDGDDSPQ